MTGRHQLVRENNDLMEENDRLIGKIEKLVEIFGSQYDSEFREKSSISGPQQHELKEAASKLVHNPAQVLSNTRLFLLSRRSRSRTNLNAPDATTGNNNSNSLGRKPAGLLEAPSPRALDLGKKKQIDRSIADLPPVDDNNHGMIPVTILSPTQEVRESPAGARKGSSSSTSAQALSPTVAAATPSMASLNNSVGGAKPKIMKSKNSIAPATSTPPQQNPNRTPSSSTNTNNNTADDASAPTTILSKQKEDLRKDLDRLDEEIQSMTQSNPAPTNNTGKSQKGTPGGARR